MRIPIALLCSSIVALAATVPLGAAAAPTPTPTPTPTPSASPSGLPIGNVKVQVTQPGQQPAGASHVEQPPINKK